MQTSNFYLLIVLLALFSCKSEQNLPEIKTNQQLDNFLQQTYNKSDFAGFSVSVIKNDEVAFQKSYGQADIKNNIALTNQTAMNIGSISKLFIGVSLMKAIEDGHFTLDTPINSILPFEVKNPNYPDDEILIKHLVTHTSGIKDDEATYFGGYYILEGEDINTVGAQRIINELGVKTYADFMTLDNFLQAYLDKNGTLYNADNFIKAKVGTTYSYSNIAAGLAAYVLETKTGMSFKEYTKQFIFMPLGMHNTGWHKADLAATVVSKQYFNKDMELPAYTLATYPDGSMLTSVEDLTLFLKEMMKAHAGKSSLLLSKESYQKLFAKQFTTKPLDLPSKEDNYGIFWVHSSNGRIGHTGGDLGTFALFGFDADNQVGSIVICNSNVQEAGDEAIERAKEIIYAYKEFEKINCLVLK